MYEKYKVPGYSFGLTKSSSARNADCTYLNNCTIWAKSVTGEFNNSRGRFGPDGSDLEVCSGKGPED